MTLRRIPGTRDEEETPKYQEDSVTSAQDQIMAAVRMATPNQQQNGMWVISSVWSHMIIFELCKVILDACEECLIYSFKSKLKKEKEEEDFDYSRPIFCMAA